MARKGLDRDVSEKIAGVMMALVDVQYDGVQRKLADRLGVTQAFVSDIVHGKRSVGPKTLIILAEIVGCDPTDLIHGRVTAEFVRSSKKLPSKELRCAVDFLRGVLPDDFLDKAMHSGEYDADGADRELIVARLKLAARSSSSPKLQKKL